MTSLAIDVRVDGALLRGGGPAVVDREMTAAMHASTQHIRGLIMPKTPVGVSATLRGGTQAKVTTSMGAPRSIEGRVFNPVAYGLPVGSSLEYADETTLYRAMAGRGEL